MVKACALPRQPIAIYDLISATTGAGVIGKDESAFREFPLVRTSWPDFIGLLLPEDPDRLESVPSCQRTLFLEHARADFDANKLLRLGGMSPSQELHNL